MNLTASPLGVKDVIALAVALGDTAVVIEGIVLNGAPSWKDLPKLFTVVTALKEFGTVDYSKVLPEFESMQDDDVSTVVAAFNGHLNIIGGTSKEVIEIGFEMIVRAGEAITTIKALLDSILHKPAA